MVEKFGVSRAFFLVSALIGLAIIVLVTCF